ncbi:hypothetical protein EVAR_66937_1 [Eumeta japonica]|uniref:Uncharacterized protein n=1 Tax=Eumeta variegata TaxID=151549 RepID=A0A4C2A1X1_EUMVA|nr:hypothetical protein EVAR_66937_1 [Eumeta japonica]
MLTISPSEKPIPPARKKIPKEHETLEKQLEPKVPSDKDVADFIESDKQTSKSSNIIHNVKNAAKLGALAVVGAPVLAGQAIVDALKKNGKFSPSDTITTSTGLEVDSSSRDIASVRTVVASSNISFRDAISKI